MAASADRPGDNGRQMHLETAPGDLAPHCLMVGSPARADAIANKYLRCADFRRFENARRLPCYTGRYDGKLMSVVTHGMGGGMAGTAIAEAARSGGRRFIRIGSCGTLKESANVGDAIIVTGSVRYDGVSFPAYAPIEFPAVADYRIVAALEKAAKEMPWPYHIGIGATSADFTQGQARPRDDGWVSPRMLAIEDELIRLSVVSWDMEDATLLTWALTQGTPGKYWVGSVKAVFANRITKKLGIGEGEDQAIEIGIRAMHQIACDYPL